MVHLRRVLPFATAFVLAAAVAVPFAVAADIGSGDDGQVTQVTAADAADDGTPEDSDTHTADPAAPIAPGIRYVAMGDSYTSAPGVTPVDSSAPAECGRSAANYPHLIAKQLGATLSDVSCGGAQTMSLYDEQFPGVPPQLDALKPDTTLVTLGIGGNDHDLFATAMGGCTSTAASALAGSATPCKDKYAQQFSEDIAASGLLILQALKNIHSEAPHAQIVVVGYPDIFPTTDAGRLTCLAAGVPFTPGDIEFLDGVERELNAMLAAQAGATQNTYLDTYTPSIGHDMCELPGVRWIEPLIPLAPAAPVHPNAAGQAAVAADFAAAVRKS